MTNEMRDPFVTTRFKVVGKTPRRAPNGRFQTPSIRVKRDKAGELGVYHAFMRETYSAVIGRAK